MPSVWNFNSFGDEDKCNAVHQCNDILQRSAAMTNATPRLFTFAISNR